MDKIEKWIEKGNVDKLQKILDKGSREEKAEVFEALGKIGNEHAINLLIANLRNADQEIKKGCVIALGETGENRAMEFLRKITRDEPGSAFADLAREAMHKLAGSKD
jgi:HEAT repeat protein